jgi:hypothetical protein
MDDPKITQPRESTEYEAPKITDYGNLAEIAAGTKTSGVTDRAFPVGTPTGSITFS